MGKLGEKVETRNPSVIGFTSDEFLVHGEFSVSNVNSAINPAD